MAAGGFFTVAAGRMEAAVHRFQREFGLNAPAILYNGARVVLNETGDFKILAPGKITKSLMIGDNMDDLRMIQTAGLGVAVANAHNDIKAAANMISLSNLEQGVYDVIEKVLNGSL